jgi:hydroxymethylpyrimidine/phosphomethylpyrimidine kinase
VLVIAGTDSSGGAGLTRDIRVLIHFEVDILCAITAVSAQSNSRVTNVHHVSPDAIRAQIVTAFETRPVRAIKIGMLGTCATVEAVVDSLPCGTPVPIVLDPVLVASSGGVLLDAEGRAAMCKKLFPRATIVTPNIPEAGMLLGEDPAIGERALIAQAQRLLALGPQAVLLKGGHADGAEMVDLLISGNGDVQRITSPRIPAICRGTGCALASAIAAGLAFGTPLLEACQKAKRYVVTMLSHAE